MAEFIELPAGCMCLRNAFDANIVKFVLFVKKIRMCQNNKKYVFATRCLLTLSPNCHETATTFPNFFGPPIQ